MRPVCFPFLFALVTLTLGALPPRAQERPRYDVIDLGTPTGVPSVANALNNEGQVVGAFDTDDLDRAGDPIQRAFLWDAEDGIRALAPSEWLQSAATGINDRGRVVGWVTRGRRRFDQHAFLWDKRTGLRLLPGKRSYHPSIPHAINRRDQVVGYALGVDLEPNATRWSQGRMRILSYFSHSAFEDVNESGLAVGWGEARDGNGGGAFVRANGRNRRLPSLASHRRIYDRALGVNDRGVIVGTSNAQAARWDRTRVTALPHLPGRRQSVANEINEGGWIVGTSYEPAAVGGERIDARAVIWRGDTITDLNTLIDASSGWQLQVGRDINNRGQIVGFGLHNGGRRAFLLNPRR